ncbi:hypothetical protein BD626DRAFT_628463 [Schizophyllum amplum]|uniref:Uncharacterized protein n=1 Tax=Schizophyllum amplum TaxID=97359 RepID=A0A550CKA8_9AGAR|nr:hypothetical protein BD626DRAFT_628463 [Auriculariopsis ampla]
MRHDHGIPPLAVRLPEACVGTSWIGSVRSRRCRRARGRLCHIHDGSTAS